MEKKQIGYMIPKQCEELLRRLAYERKCYPAQVLEDTLLRAYPAEAEMVELLGEINRAATKSNPMPLPPTLTEFSQNLLLARQAFEETEAMRNLHATIQELTASVNAMSGRAGGGR
jgi:hypothetical protein